MQLQWIIRRSRYAVIIISLLAAIPILLSLILNLAHIIQFSILIFSAILSWTLFTTILSNLHDGQSFLSWEDGTWLFCTQEIMTRGKQQKQSFSLGGILFLSIEDNKGQVHDLWLFPDSVHNSPQSWRHLHTCFFLSTQE